MEKAIKSRAYIFVRFIYLCSFVVIAILILFVIASHKDIRGVESNVVHSIQLILEKNSNLYQNPEVPPFDVTQYTPLYYVISDLILTMLKIDSSDHYSIRIYTRVLSTIILSITTIYIFLFFQRKIKLPNFDSIVFSSLFIVFSYPWFSISRPDIFVPLFFVISLNLVSSYICEKKTIQPILIGVLLFLGLASKLNMSIFIIAFGFYFLMNKYWKIMVLSTLSFITTTIIFTVITNLMGYDFLYIKKNVIDGINNGVGIFYALEKPFKNFFSYYALLILSIVAMIVHNWSSLKKTKKNSILSLIFITNVFVFLFAVVTSLKVGSAINYFNESLLCMLFLLGYILNNFHRNYSVLYKTVIMIFGINIAIIHTFFYFPNLVRNHLQQKERSSHKEKVMDYLHNHLNSNYFYSNIREISLSFPNNCILFSNDIHNRTFNRGVYDYTKLGNIIDNRSFRYIISYHKMKFLYGISIKQHFILIKEFGSIYIYELKSC